MSSSLLERTRAYHEDIDQYEEACAEILLDEATKFRDNLVQSHRVNEFVQLIEERHSRLDEIYKDKDDARREELASLEGDPTSIQLFTKFYGQVKEIKEYHSRFGISDTPVHEAKLMAKEEKGDALSRFLRLFSSAEGFGRYVDLQGLHFNFNNLRGISDSQYQLDYVSFLTTLEERGFIPVPGSTRKLPEYLTWIKDLSTYMKSFVRRTMPLLDIEGRLQEKQTVFESAWANQTYEPLSAAQRNENSMNVDEEGGKARGGDGDWKMPWRVGKLSDSTTSTYSWVCECCNMKMTKETVFKSHMESKKHEKALIKYTQHVKDVSLCEENLTLLAELAADALVATKDNVEKKQARLPGERESASRGRRNGTFDNPELDDMDGAGDDFSEDEDGTQRRRMTKKNYPIGPDGTPLPYWLYRLQGLSHEFKCQICGNASYFGRRAFERHFGDSRHAYGLKCLGIENSRDFFEITDIDKALALQKRLNSLKIEGKWDPETMEEFEDAEGTVLDKATHDLLAKQFGGM